ncbi:hypothetical protein FKM82_014739 [Ascaphus truei]
MGANGTDALQLLTGNRTAGDEMSETSAFAFKVFNITVVSIAIFILTVTTVICSSSYHKRSRQYRRARTYEATVKYNGTTSPIDITGVRRVLSIHKPLMLMKKHESTKSSSQIYFIYDNPSLASEESEDRGSHEQPKEEQMAINDKISSDVKSTGIILNPCVFYV